MAWNWRSSSKYYKKASSSSKSSSGSSSSSYKPTYKPLEDGRTYGVNPNTESGDNKKSSSSGSSSSSSSGSNTAKIVGTSKTLTTQELKQRLQNDNAPRIGEVQRLTNAQINARINQGSTPKEEKREVKPLTQTETFEFTQTGIKGNLNAISKQDQTQLARDYLNFRKNPPKQKLTRKQITTRSANFASTRTSSVDNTKVGAIQRKFRPAPKKFDTGLYSGKLGIVKRTFDSTSKFLGGELDKGKSLITKFNTKVGGFFDENIRSHTILKDVPKSKGSPLISSGRTAVDTAQWFIPGVNTVKYLGEVSALGGSFTTKSGRDMLSQNKGEALLLGAFLTVPVAIKGVKYVKTRGTPEAKIKKFFDGVKSGGQIKGNNKIATGTRDYFENGALKSTLKRNPKLTTRYFKITNKAGKQIGTEAQVLNAKGKVIKSVVESEKYLINIKPGATTQKVTLFQKVKPTTPKAKLTIKANYKTKDMNIGDSGEYYPHTEEIFISPKIKGNFKREVIHHELGHKIDYKYFDNDIYISDKIYSKLDKKGLVFPLKELKGQYQSYEVNGEKVAEVFKAYNLNPKGVKSVNKNLYKHITASFKEQGIIKQSTKKVFDIKQIGKSFTTPTTTSNVPFKTNSADLIASEKITYGKDLRNVKLQQNKKTLVTGKRNPNKNALEEFRTVKQTDIFSEATITDGVSKTRIYRQVNGKKVLIGSKVKQTEKVIKFTDGKVKYDSPKTFMRGTDSKVAYTIDKPNIVRIDTIQKTTEKVNYQYTDLTPTKTEKAIDLFNKIPKPNTLKSMGKGANIGATTRPTQIFKPTQFVEKPLFIETTSNPNINPLSKGLLNIKSPKVGKATIIPVININQDNKNSFSFNPILKTTPNSKTDTELKTIQVQKPIIKTDTKITPLYSIKLNSKSKGKNKTETFSIIDTAQAQKPIIKSIQAQKPKIKNDITQITTQRTITTPKPKKQSVFNFNTPIINQITTPTIIGGLAFPKLENKQSVKGFDVFVRKQGKFIKQTSSPLSKTQALSFGAFKVGTSASATFKIKESRTTNIGKFFGSGNLSDFKIKGGLYIEKKERRIKSIGELQEITFKGIASNKTKTKKSRFFA